MRLLILFLISFSLKAEITVSKFSGDAVDKKGAVVYRENQEITKNEKGESLLIKTKYFDPKGVLIAEVESDFKYDLFIPETVFIDHRFKERQELHYDVQTKMINMKVIDEKGKVKEKNLKREDDMVSGQGFNNYILKNFDAPKSDIKFIVLPKLDYFSFTFEPQAGDKPTEKKFVLKISSWILRALVQKIVVDYRISDKTLLKFYGLTNIESDQHDSQVLTITYPTLIK